MVAAIVGLVVPWLALTIFVLLDIYFRWPRRPSGPSGSRA
jgi:uncharacterized membrane protein YbaN (DUF454 family)